METSSSSSMAEQPSASASASASAPASASSDMKVARSVFNKISETLDNFKSDALPLLSLYEQWKNLQSPFQAFLESRAKKLELKERLVCENEKKVESLLCEVKLEEKIVSEKVKKVEMREKSVKECCEVIEVKNKEIEERIEELGLKERDFDERLTVLEFNENEVNEALEVKEIEVRELEKALEMKKRKMGEELEVLEKRKRGIGEECRCLEEKEKEMIERCGVLELREREIREEVKVLESKRRGIVEEFTALEESEREIEERCRGLEEREKEIEEMSRVQELRGREMRELREVLEMRSREIVEGRRLLEERKKGMDGTCRGLERRERELDERVKEVELRETENRVHDNDLALGEKELHELRRKLELKEREIDKGFKACCEELRLKKDQLVERHRALGLKERELVEQRKEMELKQERMNEQWKDLEVKEEITSTLKMLELKEKEINGLLKPLEGQICRNHEKLVVVQEDVDGTKTVEMKIVKLKDDKFDERHQIVVVKKERVEVPPNGQDLTTKQVEECCNVSELEDGQISETCTDLRLEKQKNQSCEVVDLKVELIRKCSNLFKQANEILNQQDMEGKQVKDSCNAPELKEELISDTCTLSEEQVILSRDKVDSREKQQASEEPQAENLPETSGLASSFPTEIQSLFRSNDAGATASYLIEHAKKDAMWHEMTLGLREEISGLIQSLITEGKHLQAAMCTCVFKMDDVFPPDFLLEAYLEYVKQKADEIIKGASATAQDDAANMELSALRDVLQCISDFKLESIYSPLSLEPRITQLEKEMEERRKPTQLLFEKKSGHDLNIKAEAPESTLTVTSTPNLSDANSDSHREKKRKASSKASLKQNKHSRSTSRKQHIPHNHHSVHVLPNRNHVSQPVALPATSLPGYHFPASGAAYGIPYDMGSGRFGVAGFYPGGFETSTLHLRGQGRRAERSRHSIEVNPNTLMRR